MQSSYHIAMRTFSLMPIDYIGEMVPSRTWYF